MEKVTLDGNPKELETASNIILLVDNEAFVRKTGERLLEELGYSVVVASNGKEALARYQENRDKIVLVILDLAMPVMDGKETLIRLRAIDPSVRVVLSSAQAKEEIIGDLLALGAAGFLEKPYTLKIFSEEIQHALNRSN